MRRRTLKERNGSDANRASSNLNGSWHTEAAMARALKTVAFCLKLGTPEIGYFEGTMIASHRTCISGQANYHHLPMFKLYKFLWRHCQPWDGKVLHFPSAGPLQILQSDSPFWWNDELNRTSLNSKHTSSCLSNATDVLPLLPRVKSSMCGSFSRSPMRCLQRMHCHLLPTVLLTNIVELLQMLLCRSLKTTPASLLEQSPPGVACL